MFNVYRRAREPRSGDICVAHGVSRGIAMARRIEPRSGGILNVVFAATFEMSPLRGSIWTRIRKPTAYAVGYVDIAAPRLTSRIS
jgi:hypothetical protein